MKKAFRILITAAVMSTALAATAFADGWTTENNQWVYYSGGSKVYNTWKTDSNGLYYYLGSDGYMATSKFVDGERYVESDGHMITSTWRQIDGKWYFFDSNGKIISDKTKQVNGTYYYFDYDGSMLTGWVNGSDGYWYYCDPSDGHMAVSSWKYLAPDDSMTLPDDESTATGEYWYYFTSNGKMAMATDTDYKEYTINSKRYAFDSAGRMATGWAKLSSTTPAIAGYKYYNDDTSIGEFGVAHTGWLSTEPPEEDGFSQEVLWFYFGSNGYPYYGTDVSSVNDDDETLVAKLKRLTKNGVTNSYLFNEFGNPVYGLRKVRRTNGEVTSMYFGTKTECCLQLGEKNITDADGTTSAFLFTTGGYGINGVKNNKLYYMGKLQKATDDTYAYFTVNGTTYLVNKTGTLAKNHNKTKDGDEVDYKSDANGIRNGGTEPESELDVPAFQNTDD